MIYTLLDEATRQYCLEILKRVGIIAAVVLVIYLTLRLPYLSHAIAMLIGIGIGVIYKFKDKVFPVIFNMNPTGSMLEDIEGFTDFKFLWIFMSIGTFLWLIYTISYFAFAAGKDWRYLVFVGGGVKEWSVFGVEAVGAAIASVIIGFGAAWLNCNIWEGCVYVLSGIYATVDLIWIIVLLKIRFS